MMKKCKTYQHEHHFEGMVTNLQLVKVLFIRFAAQFAMEPLETTHDTGSHVSCVPAS
jgi:hypothetical protein